MLYGVWHPRRVNACLLKKLEMFLGISRRLQRRQLGVQACILLVRRCCLLHRYQVSLMRELAVRAIKQSLIVPLNHDSIVAGERAL